MDKKCDACEFLKEPKNQILVTNNWNVGVGNNHAYLGRAYVTLRTHKGSLSELSSVEWQEFQLIVQKLGNAYKKAFGAEPLNWGCFMNHAFRSDPANPHVHWHIFPRYKIAPVIAGIAYEDSLYGNFYQDGAERIVSDDVVNKIASKLREHLN